MKSKELFDSEVRRCKVILENASSMGVDVSDFSNRLESIELSRVSESYSGNIQSQKIGYKMDLQQLMKLQADLMEYEVFYNILNSLKYLDIYLKDNIDKEKIIKSADEIIKTIQVFKSIKSKNDDVSKLADKLFKKVYSVIKLEFIYNDKSKVLDYVISDKTYIPVINDMILSEIDNLINSINSVFGIDNLKLEFYKNKRLDMDFVNEDIFRLLVICSDSDVIINNALEFLNDTKEKIEDNIQEVKNIKPKCYMPWSIKQYSTKFKLKLIAYLLSGSLAIGYGSYYAVSLGLGYNKLKNIKEYNTTTTTYTENIEEVEINEDFLYKIENEHQVLLEISDVLRGKRLYNYTYDVTGLVDESSLEQVPKIDVSSLNIEPLEIEKGKYVEDEEKSEYLPKYKYTVYDQDLNDSKRAYSDFFIFSAFLFGELVVYLLFHFVNSVLGNKNMRRESIEYFKDLKEKLINMKDVKISKDKVLEFIKMNELLEHEYTKFLEEKADLLKDYPEVTSQISELMEMNESLKRELIKRK